MSQTTSQEHWLRRGVRAVIRFLVRLLLLILFFLVVAVVLYYGIPWWYRTYVQPLYNLQARVMVLEEQIDRERRRFQATQESLAAHLRELQQEQGEVQEGLEALMERWQQLAERVQAQNQRWQKLAETLQQVQQRQDNLNQTLNVLALNLSELEANADEIWSLGRQLQNEALVQRAMLHLMRAQFALDQENYLEAQAELELLLDVLEVRLALLPEAYTQAWQPVMERLRQAQEALPQRPVRAQQALDAAWNLLLTLDLEGEDAGNGLSTPPAIPTAPAESGEATVTPEPTPTPSE